MKPKQLLQQKIRTSPCYTNPQKRFTKAEEKGKNKRNLTHPYSCINLYETVSYIE